MTDTLFENRLSEMLPEHTNTGSAKRSRGRLGGAPRKRIEWSSRGKRQSCTTSRFRLTAHPRLPGRSRTLSLICVVKEILLQRRVTPPSRRGVAGMAWQSKDCQPKRYNFQLVLCAGGQSGNAMASFYYAFVSCIDSSNGDIHFAPLYTEASVVRFCRSGHGGRGGNAMASFYFFNMSFCIPAMAISAPSPMSETVFHLATSIHKP